MKSFFSYYFFECEYLSYYKTKVLEIFITYSHDKYAGNGVSEF